MRSVAVFLCVSALALNAVAIQTVLPASADDSGSFDRQLVRVGVFVTALLVVLVDGSAIPRFTLAVTIWCMSLALLRDNPDQLSFVFVVGLIPLLTCIRERALVRILAIVSCGALASILLLLASGFTQNIVLDYRNRATFGTNGVPFFFNVVYGAGVMSTYYMWKFRRRYRLPGTLVALAVTVYLFTLTDARGGLVAFVLFLVMAPAVKITARFSPARRIVALTPVAYLALAFVIASLAENSTANGILSFRPMVLATFLENVTISDFVFSSSVKQFGQVVQSVKSVDNSFLHLLVGGGVVVAVGYCVLFAKAVANLYAEQRHLEIAFLISASAYFNSESILVRIENVFVIFTWYLILRFSGAIAMHDPAVSESQATRST